MNTFFVQTFWTQISEHLDSWIGFWNFKKIGREGQILHPPPHPCVFMLLSRHFRSTFSREMCFLPRNLKITYSKMNEVWQHYIRFSLFHAHFRDVVMAPPTDGYESPRLNACESLLYRNQPGRTRDYQLTRSAFVCGGYDTPRDWTLIDFWRHRRPGSRSRCLRKAVCAAGWLHGADDPRITACLEARMYLPVIHEKL